jgi:hypothetical protein
MAEKGHAVAEALPVAETPLGTGESPTILRCRASQTRRVGLGGVTLVAPNICNTTSFDVQSADYCRHPEF